MFAGFIHPLFRCCASKPGLHTARQNLPPTSEVQTKPLGSWMESLALKLQSSCLSLPNARSKGWLAPSLWHLWSILNVVTTVIDSKALS